MSPICGKCSHVWHGNALKCSWCDCTGEAAPTRFEERETDRQLLNQIGLQLAELCEAKGLDTPT